MDFLLYFAFISIVFIICLVFRIYSLNSYLRKPIVMNDKKIKLAIFVGSGGHTGEMMKIVSKMNFEKYSRYYLISNTDQMSSKKVSQVENEKSDEDFTVYYIPRSREVGQSWMTTGFSTLRTMFVCLTLVYKIKPDLILVNGPGTCVPICIISFIFNIIGLFHTRMIFVESICRVKSLSLSGKILYYVCDEFFVQWDNLCKFYPKAKYLGRLV